MAVDMVLKGTVRGLSSKNAAEDTEEQLVCTPRGELIVSQGMPPLAEIVRMGDSFQSMSTAAVAALVVRPTTAAMLSLWNGEKAAGQSYAIDSVFAFALVNPAAIGAWGIWVMNNVVQGSTGVAKPGGAALAVKSLSARTPQSAAVVAIGGAVTDDGWFPAGNGIITHAAITPEPQIDVDLKGLYIVPPGGMFNAHVVADVVTRTFLIGVRWHEIQMQTP